MRVMKVRCPRCGHLLTAYEGEPDIECYRCANVCEDGSEYGDCTVVDHQDATFDQWNGDWNWPQGMHMGRGKEQDDTQARVKFCTTHGKFIDKVPFLVKVPWAKYENRRLPKNLRFNREV